MGKIRGNTVLKLMYSALPTRSSAISALINFLHANSGDCEVLNKDLDHTTLFVEAEAVLEVADMVVPLVTHMMMSRLVQHKQYIMVADSLSPTLEDLRIRIL